MSKETENISSSMYSIYEKLMKEKADKKEAKKKKKLEEKLLKQEKKKSKEDKEQEYRNNLDKWEESLYNLTGEEIEYTEKPKKKKKYTKWINAEDGSSINLIKKQKKKKKINHKKDFEKDIEIAQSYLSEQNKINADLLKRFNLIAGPADKNAVPLSKTTVDLLSVLMSGRANSLGIIREIGNLKKISADLDIKEKQLELKKFGNEENDDNLALSGSDMITSIFNNNINNNQLANTNQSNAMFDSIQSVNNAQWTGPELESNYVKYENIPHKVVVEKKSDTGDMRFKAVRTDTGEEIDDYPLPIVKMDKLKINEENKVAKGPYDELYPLEIVN